MVFSKMEWLIMALLVIIGIYRNCIKDLMMRTVAIFLMEYLNLLLFTTFILLLETLLGDNIFHIYVYYEK